MPIPSRMHVETDAVLCWYRTSVDSRGLEVDLCGFLTVSYMLCNPPAALPSSMVETASMEMQSS